MKRFHIHLRVEDTKAGLEGHGRAAELADMDPLEEGTACGPAVAAVPVMPWMLRPKNI